MNQTKRLIYTIIISLFTFTGFTQSYQLMVQSFEPSSTLSTEDLLKWIQITSTGSSKGNVNLRTTLSHQGGSAILILEASGEPEPGMSNASGLVITKTQVLDQNLIQILDELGYLPDGNYVLCVESLDNSGEKDCFTYQFRNTALLELVYPFDKEAIEVDRPYFNWIYTQFHSAISFNIHLKEKREGQSNVEALEQNPLIFTIENHPSLFLPYPSDIDPIEPGKEYVWQVEVLLSGKPVGKSEIWSFYMKEGPQIKEYPISRSYVDLDNITTPPSLYVLGKLKFKTTQLDKTGNMNVVIINEKGKTEKLAEFNVLDIDIGENYYELKFNDIANLKHEKMYECKLSSELLPKGEVTIYFTYINPEFYKLK